MNFCVDCKHQIYSTSGISGFYCTNPAFANPVTKAETLCKEARPSSRESDGSYLECKQFEAKE
jgi:hypothetical protein